MEVCLIFFLGPSFDFMTKKGNFLSFFSIQLSTFHKMKTRTLIKILRHASLHRDPKNSCLKFERFILKKTIFWFHLVLYQSILNTVKFVLYP